MTLLEFVRGLVRDEGPTPIEPFWISIKNIQMALSERSSERVEAALSSTPKPTSDVERYAIGLLHLRSATLSGDLQHASKCCAELELLRLYNEPLGKAVADHRIGIVYRLSGRYDEAIARQLGARAHFEATGLALESALCMTEEAATLLVRGDVAGATSAYLSSLSVIEREAREPQRAAVKASLATALQRSGNQGEAERLYLQSLKERPFINPGPERATLLQNLAVIAKLDGRLVVAEERYTEALLCLEGKGLYGQWVRIMNGLADLALRQNDVDSAKWYIEAIGKISEQHITVDVQTEVATLAARVVALDGDAVKAMNIVDRARSNARDAGLHDERYELLSETLAYVKDPAFRLNLLEELAEVQCQRLKAVPSSVSSIIDLRTRYEQEKAALEIERQQERTRVIVDTEMRMMDEIGRDLHDSVGQDLTVLVMLVNQLDPSSMEGMDQKSISIVETLKTLSSRVYYDTRRLSHQMAGFGVTGTGLRAALEELGRNVTTANSACDVETFVSGDLQAIDDGVARSLLRLFQSLVQNVLRHANASKCILQLLVRPDAIVASVEDNGIGYDQHSVDRGLGTRELFARTELLGGTARIDTSSGHGTFVEITIQRKLF